MQQLPPDEIIRGITVYVLHWTIDIETTFVEGVFNSYGLAVKFIEDGIKNQKYPANHWPSTNPKLRWFHIEKRVIITSEEMFHLAGPQDQND